MKTSDKPLFHSYASDLEVGDLVVWNEWEKQDDTTFVSCKQKGAIVAFTTGISYQSGRAVNFAVVLPFGQKETRELAAHLLKKHTI